jgi:outer membrane protein
MNKIMWVIAIFLCGNVVGFAQDQNARVIQLDSVFALAERNSTRIKMSESQVDIKKSAVGLAKNAQLPSVDFSLEAKYYGDATILDRNFSDKINAALPDFGNDFALQASYVVFAGGALTAGLEKAELEAQVAALSHEQNCIDIRFIISGNYLNLYKLYNQRKVFEKHIEQTDEVIGQVKARMQEEMALDNDLTRYELLRQNLSLSLLETENNIRIINRQLTITLGLPEETVIIPDSTVQQLGTMPVPVNDYYKQAIENSRGIRIQELNKSIARNDIKMARAGLYPSVALIAGDYLTGPILVEVPAINKNLNYWYAGVGLRYNIGSLYKTKKNIAVAFNTLNTVNLAYEAETEQTKVAVHIACIRYSEAREKLETYKKSFELASQNYSVINNRYQNGMVLITEMLDAGNMKLQAELQVVNARLDVVYQYLNLLRETGTL